MDTATSKKDPFMEKIKQYALDELPTDSTPASEMCASSPNDPNIRKGAFSSLLLPHEWLRIDHAYEGAVPALPAGEYRNFADVCVCHRISTIIIVYTFYVQEIARMSGLPVRPIPRGTIDSGK